VDKEAEKKAKENIKTEGWGPGFENEAKKWRSKSTSNPILGFIYGWTAGGLDLVSRLDLDDQAQKATYAVIANQNNMAKLNPEKTDKETGKTALNLTLNPMMPAAEAYDKKSYQSADFAKPLSKEEIVNH